MTDPQGNFSDFEGLNDYIQNEAKGFMLVAHRNCRDYPGMVLCIMIRFDTIQAKYQLDLEWMSLGLDFYGDTLQESYSYQFKSLEMLLEYLRLEYNINVTDIPVKYQFDSTQFPDPVKAGSKKPVFEIAWRRFREDFKKDVFLDRSLELVHSSLDEKAK